MVVVSTLMKMEIHLGLFRNHNAIVMMDFHHTPDWIRQTAMMKIPMPTHCNKTFSQKNVGMVPSITTVTVSRKKSWTMAVVVLELTCH